MDGWRETGDAVRRRNEQERAAQAAARREAHAAKAAARRKQAKRWLETQGLMPIAWAALAGVGAIALFGLAAVVRIPCDADGCHVVAGVPAGILETAAVGVLLAGLASVGVWISHLTQRTWSEKLRLQRAELDIGKTGDADRRRRLDAVLEEGGDVAAIQQQARLYFWAGLPVAIVCLALSPYALGTFGDTSYFASYGLPIVLLGLIAGTAACVRGVVLGAAARRLTRPLRERGDERGRSERKASADTA